MAHSQAAELARDLAQQAEAVCRAYLPAGHRQGRYWIVGDVHNAPGQSLFVRLSGPAAGHGAAGRWQDASTGQHGDLIDLIGLRCGLGRFADVAAEGRRFLGLPDIERPPRQTKPKPTARHDDPTRVTHAARRLFAGARELRGTLAAAYLDGRGIALPMDGHSLRFHPRCFCRAEEGGPATVWPAMVAAVTDLDGTITGVHRTFLSRDGRSKAPLSTPRRALGALQGHAVRVGAVHDVMLAGEGIETVLSVTTVLPTLPTVAALSAVNLAVLTFPDTLRRLYIAEDNDAAGRHATTAVSTRARQAGIEPIVIRPTLGDCNDDLLKFGLEAMRSAIRVQLAPEDVPRFLPLR